MDLYFKLPEDEVSTGRLAARNNILKTHERLTGVDGIIKITFHKLHELSRAQFWPTF